MLNKGHKNLCRGLNGRHCHLTLPGLGGYPYLLIIIFAFIYIRKQGQTVPGGIKGLARRTNSDITRLTTGFESIMFQSKAQT